MNHPMSAQQVREAQDTASMAGNDCCTICGPVSSIKPLVEVNGEKFINPLFDAVRVFHLGIEPDAITIPVGGTEEVSFVAQAEENMQGDLLVNNLVASMVPAAARFGVELRSQQTDRIFMNAPVLDRFIFTNGQLRHCLPCCFAIQATNFMQVRLTNLEGVPATIRLTANARRLLSYQIPGLRENFLAYVNAQKTTPFWLTIDRVFAPGTPRAGGGVRLPAGASTDVIMTVPGGGDFESFELLSDVRTTGAAAAEADTIDITIREGVGRSIMDKPRPLSHVSQQNRDVAGMQGGEYRAASGNHCKQFSQFFKRNTRMRITLVNNSGADRDIHLAFRGCMHYYNECPPSRGTYSLEPTIGPMLIQAPRCAPHVAYPQVIPPTGFTPPTAPLNGFWPGMQGIEPADGGRY